MTKHYKVPTSQLRGILASAAKRRRVEPDALRAWHAEGWTDAQVAAQCGVTLSAAHYARRALGLPLNRSTVRAETGRESGLRAAQRRRERAGAEAAGLGIAVPGAALDPFDLKVLTELAAGPAGRVALAGRIGVGASSGAKLVRALPGLRRLGLVTKVGGHDRTGAVWSLSPATVAAAFRRDALAPLQRHIAGAPAALALADRVAAGYARKLPHLGADIESAARAGLVDAARKYDPARGVRFTTFAQTRIDGQVRDALRQSAPAGFRRGAGERPTVFSGTDLLALDQWHEVQADALPVGWEVESMDALEALTRPLPFAERTVMRLYYGTGKSMREAGAALGVSDTRASQLHAAALVALRDRLGVELQGVA